MKFLRLVALFTLLLLIAISGIAQPKYAMFIHGINSSAKDAWTDIGIPQQWVNDGIIAGYDTVFYKYEDLAKNRNAVFEEIGRRMMQKASYAQWTLVGHSLGGIVARGAYNYIKKSPNYSMRNLNIKAVTTINSPMQGANVAHASLTNKYDHYNIAPVLARLKKNLTDPLKYKPPHIVVALGIESFVTSISNVFSSDDEQTMATIKILNRAPLAVDKIIDELMILDNEPFNHVLGRVTNNTDKSKSLIYHINHVSTLKPQHIRSITTAEKAQQVVRMSSEMGMDGDEIEALENFKSLKNDLYDQSYNYYDVMAEYFKYARWFVPSFNEDFEYHKKRRDIWNKGLTELKNIDETWGEIIDNNAYYETLSHVVVHDDGYCNSSTPLGSPQDCLIGDPYETTPVIVIKRIPSKSDGLLTPSSMKWNKTDSYEDEVNNFYFSDEGLDGGYNHNEVKRYKRAYSLEGVFNKGDKADPMQKITQWISKGFRDF